MVPHNFGILASTISGNGLFPDVSKSLPEPMLINHRKVLRHSHLGNFTKMPKISILDMNLGIINSILQPHSPGANELTLKHQETHGCAVSTVATDALVLKHQAISIHNADWTFIVLDYFHVKISHLLGTTLQKKTFLKKWSSRLGVKGGKDSTGGGSILAWSLSITRSRALTMI